MAEQPRDRNTRRPGSIVRAIVVYLIFAFVVTAVWELWLHRTHEDNLRASLDWHFGGTPMTGVFTVLDDKGQPMAGVRVAGWNSSGFSEGVTDSSGITTIHFGEPELLAIDVSNRRIFDRQSRMANGLSVAKGLHVRILLKR